MRFKIRAHGEVLQVEGRAAFPYLREFLKMISSQIMIPEPPYTTKVRRRALAAIRRGEPVSDEWDDSAQPCGTFIIRMVGRG